MTQRIALVADLHGNLPAVEALDSDLRARGIDTIYCLGDMVGKGPSSAETMDWALAHCERIIAGNWDTGIGLRQFPADGYYWNQLGPERMRKLGSLPMEIHLDISGHHIRLFHGRPIMQELLYVQSDARDLEALFDDGNERFDVVGYADCHRQLQRTLSCGHLFNTGSVGNALGVPAVHYAIIAGTPGSTPAPFDLTLVTLPYDRDRAVRDALQDDGLPHRDAYIREIQTGRYSRDKARG